MTTEHSPQWEVRHHSNSETHVFYDGYAVCVCVGADHRKDADLIVRAVNAHAALLDACKAALHVLSQGEQVPEVNQLRAAIAAAEGSE